ncbi:chlorite dismutase [Brevundimonas sp. AAP58]|uniref:chlorite dismutase family protein n=1 Tax=Brevundimonas sp. AAP58 TaxID=1523422 RepID=UPI0006B8A243|nr:chlorite dismutase family protein [Brevundimonas sp. AAP58]KPF79759.1 chlorite dismutase [Brevundimonas sp. AAP58]
MNSSFTVRFTAGDEGAWEITQVQPVIGDSLAPAARLAVSEGPVPAKLGVWTLAGTTSNVRYANRVEVTALRARQAGLDRPEATRAALIPVRKSDAWWALAQDERRDILEEQSRHTAIGMDYLPQIARRLHHSRDLGEPFDFLTWFEFVPEHEAAFDALLVRLHATPEWTYVEREVDIRLTRVA